MNILLLSRYTRMGASSRLRTMQYLPALTSEGFNVQVAPFFDDAYLHALYSGQGAKGSKLGYVSQRIRQMRTYPQPDLIWLEYEALPWAPWMIERSFLPRGVPIVSDYDDAVFHRYDKNRRGTVRSILGDKIGRVMAASALVMAGNRYIANYAERFDAPRLEMVPTVVDLDLYTIDPKARNTDDLRVGWIGTPETWEAFANPIHHVLDPLLAKHRALFRAVGAAMQPATSGTLEILPWTEETEVSLIQSMDIGVMPLPNTDWARGKCGYKLIQYMACGLPVVASPVGVNSEIVEHGVNGFLAETDPEWRSAIETLLADGELRRRMGAAGRRKVEEHYSLQVWGPRVAQMLRSVADEGARA
ncbi:glycosyltransferase family 4 protein [Aliiroseovarius sp. S1123]|uniref:glycosyltransferase family 4 protein n=1 Tax=Aliiroseovarius sp. S1123 TaxID=2926404 RepID=UPI001FF2E181|nr:glycosyltransferase family 4 protein [Aliiroseovarius sp. S1123]MCK0171436.1 glycosyltransferase family 4 protein [Aliiroseovarius sp. S1123]